MGRTSPVTCVIRSCRSAPLLRTGNHQRVPIVWQITPPRHLFEDRIRIGLAARRPQGLLVVPPGVGDHLRLGVIAEEQAEPSSDLRASSMPVRGSQRVALTKLVACRIARHGVHDQLAQRAEQLDVGVGVACEPVRVIPLRPLRRRVQFAQLFDNTLVKQLRACENSRPIYAVGIIFT